MNGWREGWKEVKRESVKRIRGERNFLRNLHSQERSDFNNILEVIIVSHHMI